MDLGLSGNVVAVFGAASGIGAAIARALRRKGRGLQPSTATPQVVDLALQFPGSIGLVIDVMRLCRCAACGR